MFATLSDGESVRADRREQASVLALVAGAPRGIEWYRLADLLEAGGSAIRLIAGERTGFEPDDLPLGWVYRIDATAVDRYQELIEDQARGGVRLVTVLDNDYPLNLRQVYNRPPFLFVKGTLIADDERA